MENNETAKKKKKYEDPIIEDLVLDITDYSTVMKTQLDDKMKSSADPIQ